MLQAVGDDGPVRCVGCGAAAAGPCARCHAPLCGDCCVLTEDGAKTWAVCPRCARETRGALARGWLAVALWVAAPIALLAVAVGLLSWLAGR
jgi:hypothetical protein